MTCAPGMAHDLRGESPPTTYQEEGLAKDKGVVVRRGPKEVCSKALTRRTGNAYEARMLDEAARHVEVRLLNGKHSL